MTTAAPLLTDPGEFLYRQVHPDWVRDGRPSSQAFRPTKKDAEKLSVARSSLTTAKEAFLLYTAGRQLKSGGTWAVTVEECGELGLKCFGDPLYSPPEPVADPAHCYVDFSSLLSNGKRELSGVMLARVAAVRGCLFGAPTTV